MIYRSTLAALAAAVLLLGSGQSGAADKPRTDATGTAASSAHAISLPHQNTRPPTRPTNPLIDINTATAAGLKTLPGISGGDAAKIIAGRPYGSKAQLETRGVLDPLVYEGLKQRVIARQPAVNAADNSTQTPTQTPTAPKR